MPRPPRPERRDPALTIFLIGAACALGLALVSLAVGLRAQGQELDRLRAHNQELAAELAAEQAYNEWLGRRLSEYRVTVGRLAAAANMDPEVVGGR